MVTTTISGTVQLILLILYIVLLIYSYWLLLTTPKYDPVRRPCEPNLFLNIPAIFTEVAARMCKHFRLIIELQQLADKGPVRGCEAKIYDALKASVSPTRHSFVLWRQLDHLQESRVKKNKNPARGPLNPAELTVLQVKWSQKFPPSALAPSQPLSNNATPPKRCTATFARSPTRLHHSASAQTPLTARCPPPYHQRSETDGGVADGFFRRTECDKMTVEPGRFQTLLMLRLNADDPFVFLFSTPLYVLFTVHR